MKRRYHLGLPFWTYSTFTVLLGMVAMNSGYNLLYWVFGVMMSSILVSGFVSGAMMMAIRVRRSIPEHGIVGGPLIVRYAARNRAHVLPIFNIHFEERPNAEPGGWQELMAPSRSWVMHVGPRETVHGEAVFWPTRRGEARFDELRAWTSFPFGMLRKSVTRSAVQSAVVYPRLYALRRGVLSAITPAGELGMMVSKHAGAGDDYYGLREYRAGDSMRSIAWKRTANRDELLCVERSHPSPPKLRVILNLLRPTAELAERGGMGEEEARELEEEAISLAASIVHSADRSGFEVGLTVYGVDEVPLPVRRSPWQHGKLLSALSRIDLDAERRSGARRVPEREGTPPGVVVVHPDQVDVSLGGGEAWHFSARQLERLVDGPLAGDGIVGSAKEGEAVAGSGARESEAAA